MGSPTTLLRRTTASFSAPSAVLATLATASLPMLPTALMVPTPSATHRSSFHSPSTNTICPRTGPAMLATLVVLRPPSLLLLHPAAAVSFSMLLAPMALALLAAAVFLAAARAQALLQATSPFLQWTLLSSALLHTWSLLASSVPA